MGALVDYDGVGTTPHRLKARLGEVVGTAGGRHARERDGD
jgi:hypothetical protein